MKGSALFAALLVGTVAPAAAQPAPRDGRAIYNDRCIYCHSARGWGTRVLATRVPAGEAQLTDRKELPADYTALVIRRGIGSMPPFTPTDLSDAEIAIVARWLERK